MSLKRGPGLIYCSIVACLHHISLMEVTPTYWISEHSNTSCTVYITGGTFVHVVCGISFAHLFDGEFIGDLLMFYMQRALSSTVVPSLPLNVHLYIEI